MYSEKSMNSFHMEICMIIFFDHFVNSFFLQLVYNISALLLCKTNVLSIFRKYDFN